MALCSFMLYIILVSYKELQKGDANLLRDRMRHIGRDTVGRKVYRYSLVIALVLGIWFGIGEPTYFFIIISTFSDRLMMYRVCKPNSIVGRILVRADW